MQRRKRALDRTLWFKVPQKDVRVVSLDQIRLRWCEITNVEGSFNYNFFLFSFTQLSGNRPQFSWVQFHYLGRYLGLVEVLQLEVVCASRGDHTHTDARTCMLKYIHMACWLA